MPSAIAYICVPGEIVLLKRQSEPDFNDASLAVVLGTRRGKVEVRLLHNGRGILVNPVDFLDSSDDNEEEDVDQDITEADLEDSVSDRIMTNKVKNLSTVELGIHSPIYDIDDHGVWLQEIKTAFDSGDVVSAEMRTQQILSRHPYLAAAWFMLARIHHLRCEYEGLLNCIRKILHDCPLKSDVQSAGDTIEMYLFAAQLLSPPTSAATPHTVFGSIVPSFNAADAEVFHWLRLQLLLRGINLVRQLGVVFRVTPTSTSTPPRHCTCLVPSDLQFLRSMISALWIGSAQAMYAYHVHSQPRQNNAQASAYVLLQVVQNDFPETELEPEALDIISMYIAHVREAGEF